MTLVSGPPGAGKTVALAHWQAAGGWPGPVAWLTLDEYDDAVGHFWDHLAAALTQAGVRAPTAFNGDRDAPLLLASALAALETPAVLVLDNMHKVRSAERLSGLGYLLGHAKTGLRVVVGTRVNEPLPLHQFRLTGDVTEIHAGQLAFTGSETTRLLAGHDRASYREALIPLVKRTEGWVTGLRFVALALSGDEAADPSRLDQLISGYLTSEAFETQAPRVRDILLRTCVPERITQGLARELADRSHPVPALAELAAANLFIQPAGDGWYRYHPLFRDALRARLQEENPDLFAGLLRRAAEWHRRHGQLADAVRYAAEAGDGALAARMVVREMAVSRLLDPDRGQALLRALRDMPPPQFANADDCVCAAALALARGDHEMADAGLGRAGVLLRRLPPEEEPAARLGAAEIRLAVARRAGDTRALADAVAEQEAAVGRLLAALLSARPELTVRALTGRGDVELWLGRFDDAEKTYTEAADQGVPGQAAATDQAGCLGRIALALALSGRLIRAAEFAAKAAAAEPGGEGGGACAPGADTPGAATIQSAQSIQSTQSVQGAPPEPPLNLPADLALALVHLEQNDLARVRHSLRRVDAGLRTRPDRMAAALASMIASWLYLAEGRGETALAMLSSARQDWTPPGWLDCRLTQAEVRAEVMTGHPLGALRLVGRCDAMPPMDAATARAYAWAAADDLAAARRELRRVFDVTAAEPARSLDRVVLDALLIDARVHYAAGERAEGRAALLRADAELARSYHTLFKPDTTAGIPRALRPLAAAFTEPALVEPLTEREQEVLRRVAQLLSTAEIANELYISVNTVKTHLKSVHRKLAVTHRREAVRRAKQLKLL
ncbi:MAG TPA: LuxR C-terminal-related transcriptional regulator [Trebonia sp.]|nr:LuxR C-terminal-related transcriptional regulator [Trebonia sp.]